MSTASTAIVAVAQDSDLIERLAAVAAQVGVEGDPRQWAAAHALRLVSEPVGDSTVAAVYEYAVATYQPTPRPGADTTKVLDAHLVAAVEGVKARLNPAG